VRRRRWFRPAEQLVQAGRWLYRHGDHQQAASRPEQAVHILRSRAAVDPADRPLLAAALDTLADTLSASGRLKAAVEAARDAVTAYQRPPPTTPTGYRPALAHTLTGLGTTLNEAGQPEQAAEVVRDAVTICRDLATADAARRPQLAVALTHLALHLSSTGRLPDVVGPASEATQMWRSLPDDGYANDRVMALSVHAGVLAHTGQLEEAAVTAGEAVTELGRVRDPLDGPAADLADTLTEVAATLIKADRWDLAGPLLAELTTLNSPRCIGCWCWPAATSTCRSSKPRSGCTAHTNSSTRGKREALRQEVEVLGKRPNRRARP
jgi:tetratricopeptide (TPR) repeat protein